MNNEDSPSDLPDNWAHHHRFGTALPTWPESDHLGRAFTLYGGFVHALTGTPVEGAFPNAIAAAALFGRGYTQLRAAYELAAQGFNAEAFNLLRSVYESTGLGRMLAKEEGTAQKWIEKGQWTPDKKVREWLGEAQHESEDGVRPYANFYREASAWAHPKAVSCLGLLHVEDDVINVQTTIIFDADTSRKVVSAITWTTVFACFALRNAVVDERVIPPEWRQELFALARALSGDAMPHLERDWEQERTRFESVLSRLRDANELTETLRTDPRSWDNLSATPENTTTD
ncbi:hypothetical protein OG948_59380 (plasmid) [Embleya sp. NBC_00888]|uniref:hypothetical protein n=1 Tax=Embleya sp. NBC_00888 TaxID=2975960 RepID=UPI002F916665|nr:hypothetical protein OG948_00055 [Embleya sp. NBC_00888]WSY43324.1 hypothetical protein OG948_34010 [Embleya sp. NBC_00888]WSY43724.1 hypothetical protein OG948_34115 [Embleya sp. NBC_00888]WSY48124.1 hypothetical protein OG948_59380 [Embleya sp. NBC_00888]